MYIEKIKSPADLKKLDLKELQVVADETRQAVLNRVSKHGGHVGPNLGFVEATVALHYVFNAPKDKLVFDVSHQCYPHKVLTGRAAGFLGDVDDMNAISGYSSPAECPEYDNFEVGHTSTSVSLATGLQKARDVKGTDENIIAIIGDGSLSGGEAFEGLDEASELGTGIIIVVNDNEMSIAENHGGIYKNLRALRQSNGTCEHNWFKAWGFEYKYLEEGNDIEKLIQVFESVKDTDKPTVVHIHTEKGHGFAPAVANKEAWHWGMPFNLEDGSRPRRNADGTLPEVAPMEDYGTLFSDWMLSEMKQDKTLIAVTAGTPTAGGFTADKRQLAGKQHIDMGIAEEQAVAMISGMAKGGLHPVWTVYSTFIQRTYDQIAHPCFSTDFFHYPYNITISKFYSLSPVECIISDYFQFFHKCRDCPHLIRLQILLSIDRFFQNLTYAKICTCLYSLIFFMNFLIYFTGFPSKAHRYSEKSRQFLHFFYINADFFLLICPGKFSVHPLIVQDSSDLQNPQSKNNQKQPDLPQKTDLPEQHFYSPAPACRSSAAGTPHHNNIRVSHPGTASQHRQNTLPPMHVHLPRSVY